MKPCNSFNFISKINKPDTYLIVKFNNDIQVTVFILFIA